MDDPNVQRACGAVARVLLMDDAGTEKARRTVLTVMITTTGEAEEA